MNILITGSQGFIGKNLIQHLSEKKEVTLLTFSRENNLSELPKLVNKADIIFHLAGINRPKELSEFYEGNSSFTELLCQAVLESGKTTPIIFSSSTQATNQNDYGKSKLQAEESLIKLNEKTQNPIAIYRLPNVFGKWCKSNYNSVVATFCNNIIHNIPLTINDPKVELNLVYIDDVITEFLTYITKSYHESTPKDLYKTIPITYQTTVGELANTLQNFHEQRQNMLIDRVGDGLIRALYATYISYLPKEQFAYPIQKHEDPRGRFVEMLKTQDSGQFSYFTALPGITRGGHYHHSKTEKFLVIKGTALFKFKNLLTNEYYELITTGDTPQVVDTATGWTHDITNIGTDEMIVMLWANEVFDPNNPDTYAHPVIK